MFIILFLRVRQEKEQTTFKLLMLFGRGKATFFVRLTEVLKMHFFSVRTLTKKLIVEERLDRYVLLLDGVSVFVAKKLFL